MALFAIGDTHLSLGEDKPMDIFRGWDNYVERLEKQWNAVVSEKDTVVINGDISWAMHLKDCYSDFDFINRLNGSKIILKGNHDYWWESLTKMNNYIRDNNFDTISFLFNNSYTYGDYSICGTRGWFYDSPESDKKVILRERERLRRSIEGGLAEDKEPIVFLHYPPVFDDRVCEEIYSVLTEYEIKRCYFGHIHGDTTGRFENFVRDGIKFSLISADYLKFCPKLIEK
ncbi:MAG: metallophosphoesterase [Clostridia bacterium]|nr:metallophosphoesterase [Clostridia bacterium]